ncbi:MAG: transporter substrate-binding domain-containing protein [Proteobacteria bacterium]|nr:transporter substrate-binding domain-containing protein [Pseudomonadota bacterium]
MPNDKLMAGGTKIMVRNACVLLLVWLLLGVAHAGAMDKAVLRLAFNELPPWKIVTPDGQYSGVDIEFVRLIAEKMGLEVQIVECPFVRALRMMETGDLDCMVGMLHRPERELYLHFINPPYRWDTNKAFYLKRGRAHLIQCYEDLYGLTIGVGRGASYFEKFDRDELLRKVLFGKAFQEINMLIHGRVDAFIGTEAATDYRIRSLGLEAEIEKAPYGYREEQPVYVVFSKLSPLVGRLDEFQMQARKLIINGAYRRLRQEFLPALE